MWKDLGDESEATWRLDLWVLDPQNLGSEGQASSPGPMPSSQSRPSCEGQAVGKGGGLEPSFPVVS
jgi:hypothetical protein